VKHYNFILRELPVCRSCNSHCAFLARNGEAVALKCGSCGGADSLQPVMGVLYDLENRGRF
jgi:translation initiation factor 2 beta subunit (eIF-2beta)/eIF-5